MSQSGFIAALLLAAFVLFLAARNRLGFYTAVLWGDTGKAINHPATKDTGGGSTVGDVLSTAGTVASVAAVL